MLAVSMSGSRFPESGCILDHQIVRLAKMILCDTSSTSYDLASLVRGRHSTLDRRAEKSQNALVRGRQLCTALFIFEGILADSLAF